MTTPIKATYQGETRRFALSGTQPTVGDLDANLRRIYGGLRDQPIRIAYTDEDGDSVTVRGDDELQYAISAFQNLRINITTEASSRTDKPSSRTDTAMDVEPPTAQQQPQQQTQQQPPQEQPAPQEQPQEQQQPAAAPEPEPEPNVHVGVTCDVCGASPIVGARYKCAIREDFDMCEVCEAAAEPTHPLIKIPTRNLAPIANLCVLREEEQPTSPEAAAAAATADWTRAADFARRYLASRGPGAFPGCGGAGGFGFGGPFGGIFGAGGHGDFGFAPGGFGAGGPFGGPFGGDRGGYRRCGGGGGRGGGGGGGGGGCGGGGGGGGGGCGGGRRGMRGAAGGCPAAGRRGPCGPYGPSGGGTAGSCPCASPGGAQDAAAKRAAAAAAAVDPAAAFQSRVEAWQAELQALEQMGFVDVARNIELLERYSHTFGPGGGGGDRGLALVLQDLTAGAGAT